MDQMIVALINLIVVPLTATIPFLVSSGILLAVFAGLWALFGYALLRNRSGLGSAWLRIRHQPLVLQGAAWLLFLPVMVGLWIWRSRWPLTGRVVAIAGLAFWNLLVFIPQSA